MHRVMTDAHLTSLHQELSYISGQIISGNAIAVYSDIRDNAWFLVNSIFKDHDLFMRYFQKTRADYFYVRLDLESARNTLDADRILTDSLEHKFGWSYRSHDEFRDFLKLNNIVLVCAFDSDNLEITRYLMSLIFILGENFVFVYVTDTRNVRLANTLEFAPKAEFIDAIIDTRIQELSAPLEIERVRENVQGDIESIDRAIVRTLATTLTTQPQTTVQVDESSTDAPPSTVSPEIAESSSPVYEFPSPHNQFEQMSEQSVLVLSPNEADEIATVQKESVAAATFSETIPTTVSEVVGIDNHEIHNAAEATESIPSIQPQTSQADDNRRVEQQIKKSERAERLAVQHPNGLKLTAREQSILDALRERTSISRQEVAIIAWGEEKGAQATDDAIDQVLSRLRKKLVNAGYPKTYITSVKGEGVFLNEL